MRFRSAQVVLYVTALGAPLASCSPSPPPLTPLASEGKRENRTPLSPEVSAALWRVRGDGIVDGEGNRIVLRGITFGNQVGDDIPIPSGHHTGLDFTRVAGMGMNTVRFSLSYRTFEDDDAPGRYKQAGWDWVDQNVEWARENGVRLVLDMHAPKAGAQSSGGGKSFWQDDALQTRFVDLWQAIAERYRAEPTIAGFAPLQDFLPAPTIDRWKEFAQRSIAAIRAVDQHHMLFIERAPVVGEDRSDNEEYDFFRVSDPNVVYAFHFYEPYHFTHQGTPGEDFVSRESWYPDPTVVEVDGLEPKARAESEPMPAGESDWTFLETELFEVKDLDLVVGKPFLVCDAGKGSISFDNLSLTKIPAPKPYPGATEKATRSVKTSPDDLPEAETVFELDLDTRRGWFFWTQNGEGMARFEPRGQGDQTAVVISGTTGPASLGSDPLRFLLEPGARYQLHGVARGRGLAEDSRCLLRLEFFSSKETVHVRDKQYLQAELRAYQKWGEEQQVPVYLGEFGTIRDSFHPGRGGLKWVEDMLDIIVPAELHFSYHLYHEPAFGLFDGEGDLPAVEQLNRPLYDLFVLKLNGSGVGMQSASPPPETTEPHEQEPSEQTESAGEESEIYDFE